MRFIARVSPFVDDQVLLADESLVACVALEDLLAHVITFVHH